MNWVGWSVGWLIIDLPIATVYLSLAIVLYASYIGCSTRDLIDGVID